MYSVFGEYRGFDYCVKFINLLSGSGHYCGYVKLKGEKLLKQESFEDGLDDVGIICHGGITFDQTDALDWGPKREGRWIGFDCNHYDDPVEKYDATFVENECKHIIDQLRCWEHGVPDASELGETPVEEEEGEPSTEELKREIGKLLEELRELKDILAAKLTAEKFKDFEPKEEEK